MEWFALVLALLFLFLVVGIPILVIKRMGNHEHTVEQRYNEEEEMETIDVYVVERGKKGTPFEPITLPEHPWLSWLAHFTWFQQWQFYYGYNREQRARAGAALDLYLDGKADEFFAYIERDAVKQDDHVVESTIKIIPEDEPVPGQQEEGEQGSTTTPQWSLSALKDNGQWAHYHTYAWGMLAYLYHHLPESGTIHRDNNKRENGYVGGKVISNIQWDQFIGSSDPSSQKGQGLLRRAGLIREEEREGRKVSVFTHKDVGQAIDKLIQYTIKEQQGERDEEEKSEDTITPTRPDSSLPLPNYQWQEYR